MKILAILLLLLVAFVVVVSGLLYLFGFAMSFDAPGSESDPKAWAMRLLMLVPTLLALGALIYGLWALRAGRYPQTVLASGLVLLLFGGIFLYMVWTSAASLREYNAQVKQEAADAERYPKQTFIREVEGGSDTILVFPNRIVAYRLYKGTERHWGGPVGDLNESREVILYEDNQHNMVSREELSQFVDANGRRLTEVYRVE